MPCHAGYDSGGHADDTLPRARARALAVRRAGARRAAVRVVFGAGALGRVAAEVRASAVGCCWSRVPRGRGGRAGERTARPRPRRAAARRVPARAGRPGGRGGRAGRRCRRRRQPSAAGRPPGWPRRSRWRRRCRPRRTDHLCGQRDDADLGAHRRAGKRTGRDARVLPRTVVYDPALTVSLPPDVSAASGMNAIAHAVESLYAPDVTPEVARRSVEEACVHSPRGCRRPYRNPATSRREEALYGAWLAGLGARRHDDGAAPQARACPRRQVPPSTRRDAQRAAAAGDRVQRRRGAPSVLAPAAAPFGGTVAADLGPALYDLAGALRAPTSLAAARPAGRGGRRRGGRGGCRGRRQPPGTIDAGGPA